MVSDPHDINYDDVPDLTDKELDAVVGGEGLTLELANGAFDCSNA